MAAVALMMAVPAHLSLEALVRRCELERDHFQRGLPQDTRFAHELLRRALVERDEAAWEHTYAFYRPQVERWVRRGGAFTVSGESVDYFVSEAFVRFWRNITPERFAAFPSLAALMAYLQRCARCAVLDAVDGPTRAEVLPDDEQHQETYPAADAPDEQVLAGLGRSEFWRCVTALLHGEAEREVVYRSFLLDMKPAEIFAERRDLFASVTQVYAVKRNVLARLARHPEVQRLVVG